MNILEKELTEKANASSQAEGELLNSAKLLLESNTSAERQLLKLIGLTTAIELVEDETGRVLSKKNLSDRLGKIVVTKNQLHDLCLKYRLYMLPARLYVGTIPPTLGAELKRFCEERNIPVPNNNSLSNFYIVAPPKMFRGYRGFWKMGADLIGDWSSNVNRAVDDILNPAPPDPILVYREGDYFAVVKSWGNDLSIVRRFMGVVTRKASLRWINFLFHVGMIALAVKASIWVVLNIGFETAGAGFSVFGLILLMLIPMLVWFIGASEPRKKLIDAVTARNESKDSYWNKNQFNYDDYHH